MTQNFLRTLLSASVLQQQTEYYGRSQKLPPSSEVDRIGSEETAFIRLRDSFYLATVSPDGWPYIQHRGGPEGFLKVLDDRTLAFADFTGNRQLLSTGNLAANDRVALFLMDYPQQARLKILGHAEILSARLHPALAAELTPQGIASDKVERIFRIHVIGVSWNCPKYITPRFTLGQIQTAVEPLRQRIADLEAALAQAQRKSALA